MGQTQGGKRDASDSTIHNEAIGITLLVDLSTSCAVSRGGRRGRPAVTLAAENIKEGY